MEHALEEASIPGFAATRRPLAVDLDGTVLRTDLLHESVLLLLRQSPWALFLLPLWLLKGRAHLKRRVAERVQLDVTSLPYRNEVLDWVRAERAAGRQTVLCTASDRLLAEAVSEHLGAFDSVMASDGATNLKSRNKAAALVARFGERGYDYVGNSRADLAVWSHSDRAVVVGSESLVRKTGTIAAVERSFPTADAGAREWVRALRLHQWAKNALLFLPLLGSHQILQPGLLERVGVAFIAFGFCASSVYIVNDLMDLESDRHHPRKRTRPFASGLLSAVDGALLAASLLAASFAIAWQVAPAFLAWLLVYFAVTVAYTFWLKRKEIVDTLSLAALYTLRIIAGGAAVSIAPSFWLLAFSLFLFLSLAFVKRFSELQLMADEGRDEAKGRGYRTSDLPLLEVTGMVSAFAAVLVLALYINGDSVVLLYRRPELMWLTVPILLYWVTRLWMKAHRGLMHDDPVLFAMKDRVSILSGLLFLGVMWAAI